MSLITTSCLCECLWSTIHSFYLPRRSLIYFHNYNHFHFSLSFSLSDFYPPANELLVKASWCITTLLSFYMVYFLSRLTLPVLDASKKSHSTMLEWYVWSCIFLLVLTFYIHFVTHTLGVLVHRELRPYVSFLTPSEFFLENY